MKRSAEKQLTQNNVDDDDIEEVSDPGTGLSMADEATLAKRKIKGLPKRSSTRSPAPPPASTPAVTEDTNSAPAPKLMGFSGFGSSASSSSSPFGAPSVAPSASNATKTSVSFLESSSSSSKPPAAPPFKPAPSSDLNDDTLKYYTSLRGLNNSFITAISKAVEADPFIDIADVLEQYKKHRISVQREFDAKSRSPPPSSSTPAAPSAPTSMPAPPTSFAGFPPVPSSSSFPAPTGGFTLAFGNSSGTAKTLAFAFGGASSAAPAPSAPAPAPAKTSDFSFGGASSTPTPSPFGSSSAAPPSTRPASLEPDSTAESGSSTTQPKELSFRTTDSSMKPTSAFGGFPSSSGSLFGLSSGSRPSSFFGSTSSDPKPDTDTSPDRLQTPFSFSAPTSIKLFGEGSAFGAVTPEKTAFGSPGKTSPFNFGSGGSPVSFGFGVSPKAAGDRSPTPKAGSIGFSFGAPTPKVDAPAPAPRADTPATEATEGSQDDDGLSRVVSPAPLGVEGDGEEDEDLTYTAKTKLFKLGKDAEGKSEWRELGVGMLRLKAHKQTGSRRVLLRNQATSKIVLNFNIYAGLAPTTSKKTVSFVGHNEEGKPTTYRLRFADDATASAAKDALNREVVFVKESGAS